MDPEQTFLRVHARLSGMLSQLLTPRIRAALAYLYLAVAVALFCLLVVMHTNFVQQPGCSSELSGIEFAEAQLVQIKIVSAGLWLHTTAEQSVGDLHKRGNLIEKPADINGGGFSILADNFWSSWMGSDVKESGDPDVNKPQEGNAAENGNKREVHTEADTGTDSDGLHIAFPLSARESFKAAISHLRSKWHMRFASLWKTAKRLSENAVELWNFGSWNTSLDISKCLQMLRLEHMSSSIVQWLARRSEAFEPTYLYTLEKGYFLLSEGAKLQHNIRTINITISAQNSCFGNRWQQLLVNSFVGYDTILMNSLLNTPGRGYLYNYQTKEFYDLNYGHEPSEGPAKFGDFFVTKCGVLIMSLFVFFTTTMSVSFTLRETQSRMLKFTVQLQHHARHQLPTFQLIFVHVLESLVFVPIMIGILFFLFEFYDDQLLAFLVLTLVWLCEVFTMISVRTSISMQFFPRFFLLYFLVFHIYFFSYAYGFSYLAFAATAAFMQHLILYFWNRFEVPALQRYMRSRGQLEQQAGVQITSSTIYTSTLHIARVNVRNTGIINNGMEAGSHEPFSGRGQDGTEAAGVSNGPVSDQQSTASSADSVLQAPDVNSRQTETSPPAGPAPTTGFPNFGSLLLWLLGGGPSDGVVSFFSMFRDVPDQGQAYQEPTRSENEPGT